MTEEAHPPALLLDLDGTLVDTAYLHTVAWQRALRAGGFEMPAYRIHRLIGMGGDQLVSTLLGESVQKARGEELSDGWNAQYQQLLPDVRALPGAASLIRHAGDAGWSVVFASSAPSEHLEHYLGLLGAEGLRDRATTSDDVDRTKPSPDLIEIALELAGTRRALLIGDSTHDVRAAARAGISTACVLSGGYSADELLGAGAVRIYETPQEILQRFGELDGFLSLTGAAAG